MNQQQQLSKDGFDPDQPEQTLIRLKLMEDFKFTTYEVESMPPCIKGLRTERGFIYMVCLFAPHPLSNVSPTARVLWVREDGAEPSVGHVLRMKKPFLEPAGGGVFFYPSEHWAIAFYETDGPESNQAVSERLIAASIPEAVTFIVEKSASYLEEKLLASLNVLGEAADWPPEEEEEAHE